MRSREEIYKQADELRKADDCQRAIVEVLLDIREILNGKEIKKQEPFGGSY